MSKMGLETTLLGLFGNWASFGAKTTSSLETELIGQSQRSLARIIKLISDQTVDNFDEYKSLSLSNQNLVHEALDELARRNIDLSDTTVDIRYENHRVKSKNNHSQIYSFNPILIVNNTGDDGVVRQEKIGLPNSVLYAKKGNKSRSENVGYKLHEDDRGRPNVTNAVNSDVIGDLLVMTEIQGEQIFNLYSRLEKAGISAENLEFLSQVIDYTRFRNIAVSQQRWDRFGDELTVGYVPKEVDLAGKLLKRAGYFGAFIHDSLRHAAKKLNSLSQKKTVKFDDEEANNWIDLNIFLEELGLSSADYATQLNELMDSARLGNADEIQRLVNGTLNSLMRADYGTIGEHKDGQDVLYLYPENSDAVLVTLSPSTNKQGFTSAEKSFQYANAAKLISDFYRNRFDDIDFANEVEFLSLVIGSNIGYGNSDLSSGMASSQILEMIGQDGLSITNTLDEYSSVILQGITNLKLLKVNAPKSDEFDPDFVTSEMVYQQSKAVARSSNFLLWLLANESKELDSIDIYSKPQDLEKAGELANLKYIALVGKDVGLRVAESLDDADPGHYFEQRLKSGIEGDVFDFESFRDGAHRVQQSMDNGQFSSGLEESMWILDKIEYVQLTEYDQIADMRAAVGQVKELMKHFNGINIMSDPVLASLFSKKIKELDTYLGALEEINRGASIGGVTLTSQFEFESPITLGTYLSEKAVDPFDVTMDMKLVYQDCHVDWKGYIHPTNTADHLTLRTDMTEQDLAGKTINWILHHGDLTQLTALKNYGKKLWWDGQSMNRKDPRPEYAQMESFGDAIYDAAVAQVMNVHNTSISSQSPIKWVEHLTAARESGTATQQRRVNMALSDIVPLEHEYQRQQEVYS